MIVSDDGISEVEEMTTIKLIEIVEALESGNGIQGADRWDILFH